MAGLTLGCWTIGFEPTLPNFIFYTQQYGYVPWNIPIYLTYVFWWYHCWYFWNYIGLSTIKTTPITYTVTWTNIACGYLQTIHTLLNGFLLLLSTIFRIHLFDYQQIFYFVSVNSPLFKFWFHHNFVVFLCNISCHIISKLSVRVQVNFLSIKRVFGVVPTLYPPPPPARKYVYISLTILQYM